MKIKNLEVAKKYGFVTIFKEENLPTNVVKWRDDFNNEELERFINLHTEDDVIRKETIVVSDRSDLYYYDDCLAYNMGHSRRGQFYYILCDKETLDLTILATSPDGSGCDCDLPDVLVEMILNGDVVLK